MQAASNEAHDVGGGMSIREIFSNNLRGLTRERGALARLNEATGIGRVQLNRYMKGTLPNDQNIAAIAEHFRVSGESLFRDDFLETRNMNQNDHKRIDSIKRRMLDGQILDILPGRYMVYLASAVSRELVVQSPMFVRSIGDHTTFRRYTDVMNKNSTGISPHRSVHDGFIRKAAETYFFLGVNIKNGCETTLLALSRFPINTPALIGSAVITTEKGPVSANALVVRSTDDTGSARAFIAKARAVLPREAEHADLIDSILFASR